MKLAAALLKKNWLWGLRQQLSKYLIAPSVFGAARGISPQAQPPPYCQVAAGLSSGASTLEGGCKLYSGPQEERVLRTPEEGFSSPEPRPGPKPSFPSDLGLHQTLPHFMRKQVCRRLEQADTTGQKTPTSTPQDPSSAEELRKSCLKTRGCEPHRCDWRQASGRPAPINKAVGTNKD